jgi:hypothetical protein
MSTNAFLHPEEPEFLVTATSGGIPLAHGQSILESIAGATPMGLHPPAKRLRSRAAQQRVERRCAAALKKWADGGE